MSRRLVPSLVVLLVLATAPAALAAPGTSPGAEVDVVVQLAEPGGVAARAATAREHGITVSHSYERVLEGFAGAVPRARLGALARDPRVAHVEAVEQVSIDEVATGLDRTFATGNALIPTGLDGDAEGDVDADIAIVDTGIGAHPDLNVVASVDCTHTSNGGPPWERSFSCVEDAQPTANDGNGHGTHVAGTAAARVGEGNVVGMAPGARLHAVRVLDADGGGDTAGVIAGLDWVAARADTIEVANLSLGSPASDALDAAVAATVDAGVVVVVSAGNDTGDAGATSPAREESAITVSAIADHDGQPGGDAETAIRDGCADHADDELANFSNHGEVVDIAAPGVCILSLLPDGSYVYGSGTSMAAPHVAGAAALLASAGAHDPGQVDAALGEAGNHDWDDTSGDGHHEPLLDVSDEAVFAPSLLSGDPGDEPDEPGEPQEPSDPVVVEVAIHDASRTTGPWWRPAVTLEVTADGSVHAGVPVAVSWTGAVNGSGSCTTDGSGVCQLELGRTRSVEPVHVTVTHVDGAELDPPVEASIGQ